MEDRRSSVIVSGAQSVEAALADWVYQGTVLGPPLWNLFYKDAAAAVKVIIHESLLEEHWAILLLFLIYPFFHLIEWFVLSFKAWNKFDKEAVGLFLVHQDLTKSIPNFYDSFDHRIINFVFYFLRSWNSLISFPHIVMGHLRPQKGRLYRDLNSELQSKMKARWPLIPTTAHFYLIV